VNTADSILFPAVSLVVSGGHTELYLMESPKKIIWLGGTIDDAAGECFDKTARLLGFGHGGGVAIQNAALLQKKTSNPVLPRPMLDKKNALNFSFSGLKTAILRQTQKLQSTGAWNDDAVASLSYEVQEAITDVLVKKTLRAAQLYKVSSILLSGGVSANIRLRKKFAETIREANTSITLYAPPVPLCTDNAVYIASYAHFRGNPLPWEEINAFPDLPVEVHS
jgi:N6-L-threonylcarbamoyladenine synthase